MRPRASRLLSLIAHMPRVSTANTAGEHAENLAPLTTVRFFGVPRTPLAARTSMARNERAPGTRNAPERWAAGALVEQIKKGVRGQDLNLRPSGYEPDELPG